MLNLWMTEILFTKKIETVAFTGILEHSYQITHTKH